MSWWPAGLLTLAVVLAYANSLSGPFVLDDEAAIVTNAGIRDLGRLGQVLTPAPDSPVAGRPLVNLSFALNYAAGGLEARGYHAVNIAVHVVCAWLLLMLCRRTLSLPAMPGSLRANATPIALAVALLWAVHPLNSEAINYLSQRTESLMAMFFLATMYAAVRSRDTGRAAWDGAAVAACALGMMCKESMVTAPVVVVLYDRVFLFDSWKTALARRRRLYAGLAATWVVLAVLIAGAPRSSVAGFSAGVPVWTNLLNQAAIITGYLWLAVWPRELVAFYGWHVPLTLGGVLPQVILIASLALATLVALWRLPMVGFLGAWFFITLAPSSSIVPIATEVGAERRMYLPLMAMVALGTIAAFLLLTRLSRGRPMRIHAATVAVVAAALAAGTMARNREYGSALTLARTIVERRPTGVAYQILGEQLLQAGQDAEAASALREAIARGDSRAGYALGAALVNERQYAEAIERLDAFVQTSGRRLTPRWLEPSVPEVVAARLLIARVALATGDADRAAQQAEAVLNAYPRHVEAQGALGDARYTQQRWPEAVRAYRGYLAARSSDVGALINFGVASVAVGALDQAVGAFERATALAPDNQRARQLLTMALRDRAQAP